MRPLYYHELVFIGGANGATASSSCGCEVCDDYFGKAEQTVELDTVEVKGSGLGLPNITNDIGHATTIGGLAGNYFGPTGALVGSGAGYFIDNFDWEWYRQYRDIAQPIEQEYSGGLP